MKKYFQILFLAILSGLAIGIGGTIYLSMENKIVGALMFTVGLYAICTQGLMLFTGKVGYMVNNSLSYILDLVVIWIGNFIGTFTMATLISQTRVSKISETAKAMCKIKTSDNFVSLFILGIFCGMLMYIAVDGYKKTNNNPVILFMGVGAFIFCGFEHCIADMFYFSIANKWSVNALLCILVITVGNSVGGMLIPLVQKFKVEEKAEAEKTTA